jgi:hypothetical protein
VIGPSRSSASVSTLPPKEGAAKVLKQLVSNRSLASPTRSAVIVVSLLLCSTRASAQDLALTKDAAFAFQRIIRWAETGRFGDDVVAGNVEIAKDKVQVELVGRHGMKKFLRLSRKQTRQGLSRYFDIEPGEGATASDARRLGTALDEAFGERDPFVAAVDFIGTTTGSPIPGVAQAWKEGGWRNVLRVLEWRLVVPTGRWYTTAVLIALVVTLLAGLVLLWGGAPPDVGGREGLGGEKFY